MSVASRRSVMTVYSRATDPYSHIVRIVLAEKGITYDVIDIDHMSKAMEEMLEFNPYGDVPTLVDRDLVLYSSRIISEYLDERFPHPPLMPIYPVARGRSRLIMHRVSNDWYKKMDIILTALNNPATQAVTGTLNPNPATAVRSMNPAKFSSEEVIKARRELTESIISTTPVFAEMPFFLSEEFSLVDCSIAALLWRLPMLEVKLPPEAKAIEDYMQRVFTRESFQTSLTDAERTMRMHSIACA